MPGLVVPVNEEEMEIKFVLSACTIGLRRSSVATERAIIRKAHAFIIQTSLIFKL